MNNNRIFIILCSLVFCIGLGYSTYVGTSYSDIQYQFTFAYGFLGLAIGWTFGISALKMKEGIRKRKGFQIKEVFGGY